MGALYAKISELKDKIALHQRELDELLLKNGKVLSEFSYFSAERDGLLNEIVELKRIVGEYREVTPEEEGKRILKTLREMPGYYRNADGIQKQAIDLILYGEVIMPKKEKANAEISIPEVAGETDSKKVEEGRENSKA